MHLPVYYLLYDKDGESPSKVSFDPEQPSLGRIRADSVAPCHTPASLKRRISRVEKNPALAVADLLADVSCDSPMKEVYMQILNGDVPGLSQYEPMVLVQDVVYTRRVRAKITRKLKFTCTRHVIYHYGSQAAETRMVIHYSRRHILY
jgi:hypothetical protein